MYVHIYTILCFSLLKSLGLFLADALYCVCFQKLKKKCYTNTSPHKLQWIMLYVEEISV